MCYQSLNGSGDLVQVRYITSLHDFGTWLCYVIYIRYLSWNHFTTITQIFDKHCVPSIEGYETLRHRSTYCLHCLNVYWITSPYYVYWITSPYYVYWIIFQCCLIMVASIALYYSTRMLRDIVLTILQCSTGDMSSKISSDSQTFTRKTWIHVSCVYYTRIWKMISSRKVKRLNKLPVFRRFISPLVYLSSCQGYFQLPRCSTLSEFIHQLSKEC